MSKRAQASRDLIALVRPCVRNQAGFQNHCFFPCCSLRVSCCRVHLLPECLLCMSYGRQHRCLWPHHRQAVKLAEGRCSLCERHRVLKRRKTSFVLLSCLRLRHEQELFFTDLDVFILHAAQGVCKLCERCCMGVDAVIFHMACKMIPYDGEGFSEEVM